ncbi:DUF2384 domain-containing protein [Pseudomonas mandelii]|uniref:antitoxin Xre/MbcA/ParS toxin-binding domain-containing protein n=1 Tax=Pseudomonas mandelii TaxID=75612 RepID=UPI001C829FE6|nr:antitoxin Xre-like helix-turn-helix domain-containing protein [Pseudomonas mandelii]QZA95962.1 DUF2384 domain-containing protein [Pseudomonas mandelii]
MTLGLPTRGARLHDLVHEGLPFGYLERIASFLQVSRGVVSKAIRMSPTTVALRAKAIQFNAAESDRLIALVAVYEVVTSLFEGDASAATEWMTSPIRGLGMKRPSDMLRTKVETRAVFDLIGQ